MSVIDFTRRSDAHELMETESVSFDDFRECLQDLARVNRLTFAARPTLLFLERLVATFGHIERPIEVLDVGSGFGDTLRAVHTWATRRRVSVALTGIDRNPWATRAAEQSTPPDQHIEWVTDDIFSYRPPRPVDVVISSQFTHHLTDALLIRFLGWMESTARLGWFVSDLHRHPLPYHFFRFFSKAARFHRFVQHDGPVSIARSFSRGDWQRFIEGMNIVGGSAKIEWRMPFRFTVARLKRP